NLALANTQISGAGLKNLTSLPLEELRLNNSPISDASLSHIAQLAGLRDLGLAYSDVTNDGLGQLTALGNLKRLDLAGTDIGDKGLAHVAKLTALTSLS